MFRVKQFVPKIVPRGTYKYSTKNRDFQAAFEVYYTRARDLGRRKVSAS